MDVYFFKEVWIGRRLSFTSEFDFSILGWILINFKQNKNLVLNLPELITRSNAKFTGQFSLYRLKTPVSKVNSSV